jgi:DNA-binding NtrC family response regulator/tetratricopeptide (TPR) repeat protein
MHALWAALSEGRFRDALDNLRASQQDETLSSDERDVLMSELLERIGRPMEARQLARRVLARMTTATALHVRCLTILGSLAQDAGDLISAVEYLKSALQRAEESGAWREGAWARLRLFLVLADTTSPESLATQLGELRRAVIRLGDPAMTVALHLSVAETESRRGVLESASRHLHVARALLDSHRDYWLEGLAEIDSLCLEYMLSDPDKARMHAERAIGCVAHSGHAKSYLAVISNLAHVDLAQNRLSSASENLHRALRLSEFSVHGRVAALDGLAQLEMARGNNERAAHYLKRVSTAPAGDLSYCRLWSERTRLRLLLLTDSPLAVLPIVTSCIARANAAGDRALIKLLHLLRAEARAELGEVAGAADDIVHAAAPDEEPPLEVLAEIHRVTGKALLREGDPLGARVALQRSARILRGIGHLRAQVEVEREADACGPVPAPDASSGDLAAAGQFPAAEARPDLLLRTSAALLEQAGRPDLLGREILGLVLASGCATAAAVVSTKAGRDMTVEHRGAWTDAEALAAAASPDPPALTLGTWREREWCLVASVAPTVSARTAWLAVHSLASSGRALAAARRDAREREALWPIDNPDDPSPGVFASEQMTELLRVARRLAVTPMTVLLTGETGVGKEVIARVIHDASRAGKPFVPFNCSAVPRDMIENQLFGHRRGAYTGADAAFPGVIRSAEGGTVFLDEIGEIGMDLQPKLLRFLETGEVQPLGEAQPVRTNVRVIAATNQNLAQLVREGRFRDDLFYRLNVGLHIPPLRERREEIPKLVEHFLDRVAREFHKGRLRLADETMEYLVLYAWPGNVRQLMNEIRRVAALAETGAVLMPEHLHADIVSSRRTRPASERELEPTELVVRMDQPLAAATEHLERAMIQHAMRVCHGRVEQVAKVLGLSRKGLYLKRQRLGIEPVAC